MAQQAIYSRLGCPTGRDHASRAAEEAFQEGSMLGVIAAMQSTFCSATARG